MNKERLKILNEIWEETETLGRTYSSLDAHLLRNNSFQRIRKEGIKWIKNILKCNECELDDISFLNDFNEGQLEWTRYFFSITDEELK